MGKGSVIPDNVLVDTTGRRIRRNLIQQRFLWHELREKCCANRVF